jgi:tetratricopeptide (TPR) repeat protein
VRIKDPTEWMNDLTVFVDDEEIEGTAALLEPDLVYGGSKLAGAIWLSLVGIAAGAFAAVTFSAEIRSSITAFAFYLVTGLVLFGGLSPASRMLGKPVVWPARFTFFWAALLACLAVFSAGFTSPWLAYGLTIGSGFFVGMMKGALNPHYIKQEEGWMVAALASGTLGAVIATLVDRRVFGGTDTIAAAAVVGGIAGGMLSVPMSFLLFRLWNEAHGFKQMAMLFLHNDNFAPKAVSYLDSALALAPSDPELYNLRAVAWSRMDDAERAAADWRRALELNPDYADPHLNRGLHYLRRGELDAAIDALGKALALDPENPTVHCGLGTALERRGEFDRAIAHFDKAIAQREDYADAYSSRGYARFRKGDYEEAVVDCEQALEFTPEFPAAAVNRGHALSALGRHGPAAQSYRAAIEMRWLSPELHAEALRGLEALAASAARGAR